MVELFHKPNAGEGMKTAVYIGRGWFAHPLINYGQTGEYTKVADFTDIFLFKPHGCAHWYSVFGHHLYTGPGRNP